MINERDKKKLGDTTIQNIINLWNQGKRLDAEGYEDLGFTLQHNALLDATKLDPSTRKKIADILFPIK